MAVKKGMQTISSDENETEQEILDTWVPAAGCLGYGLYSLKIFQPNRFSDLFGSLSPRIEDTVWVASELGLAVYIYRGSEFFPKSTCPRTSNHPKVTCPYPQKALHNRKIIENTDNLDIKIWLSVHQHGQPGQAGRLISEPLIYRQRCLQKAPVPWRIAYSGFGSTFFNLGSNLMMWVASKAVFHRAPEIVKLLAGLSTGCGLMYIGWHFINFLNSATT